MCVCGSEVEFQRTALSACRGTIAQQETELKRLKECVDIRNKRVLQLEAQIGHASEFVAARDRDNPANTTEPSLLASLDRIESKLSSMIPLQPPVSNSIVVNTNHPGSQAFSMKTSIATQTENTDDAAKDNKVTDEVPNVHTDDDEPDTIPPAL